MQDVFVSWKRVWRRDNVEDEWWDGCAESVRKCGNWIKLVEFFFDGVGRDRFLFSSFKDCSFNAVKILAEPLRVYRVKTNDLNLFNSSNKKSTIYLQNKCSEKIK